MRRSALLVAFAVLLAACGWPMFGGNAGHTGYNPFERTINGANAYQLSEAWTAPLPTSQSRTSPVVSAGVLYVSRDKLLYAFAANGATNCSGAPKKCSPLWTATFGTNVGGAAAVANGFVYVPAGNTLYAFDAAGSTNCSGTPKTCGPVWTATGTGPPFPPTPAASRPMAFDASGVAQCGGTPKSCEPVWDWDLSGSMSAAAVADGVVYVSTADLRLDTSQELGALYAFHADGCGSSGCPPISSGLGAEGTGLAIANGVLYMERRGAFFEPDKSYFTAIDLSDGGVAKSLGYPTHITPPIIANGVVYFVDETALRAFELP